MDADKVNHVERDGVLPIAFSLFHQAQIEDTSLLMLGGPPMIWNDDVGRPHRPRRPRPRQAQDRRRDDGAAHRRLRRLLRLPAPGVRPDRGATSPTSTRPRSPTSSSTRPFPPQIASTYSARVAGEAGITAPRRHRVLDLPARPPPHGRDRARPGPRRPRRHDLVIEITLLGTGSPHPRPAPGRAVHARPGRRRQLLLVDCGRGVLQRAGRRRRRRRRASPRCSSPTSTATTSPTSAT